MIVGVKESVKVYGFFFSIWFLLFFFFVISVTLSRTLPEDPDPDPCDSVNLRDFEKLRSDQISVLINGYSESRIPLLQSIVAAYSGSSIVSSVLVLWGNPTTPAPLLDQLYHNLTRYSLGTVSLIQQSSSSLNARFLPRHSLDTRAVLICDDDVEVDRRSLEFAFSVWKSNPDRLVGMFVRSHGFDLQGKEWIYTVHPDKYSIVLTKFMMMKQDYLFEYSCNGGVEMDEMRKIVDQMRNCEDILMNFVAADKLRAGPIMVGAERVRDWGDARNEEQVEDGVREAGLSSRRGEHRKRRGYCIREFHRVMGKMPLLYSYGRSIPMDSHEEQCVPILDFSRDKLMPGTTHWTMIRDSVRRAMEEQGWFVAEFNGVSSDLRDDLLSGMKEMYDLPYEVKIKNENHKASHGYMSMVVDDYRIHESLGIDYATELQACKDFSKLLWPQGNDPFCEATHRYAMALAGLDQTVMKMLYESYGMDQKKHSESHSESTRYLLRMLSYRRQRNGEANTGFVSHTDKSFMSILHQNHVLGLQLKTMNDQWVGFSPSPTRFVVLSGMGLTAWSNDRIKPCYHRVVMSADEIRYSLGFFSFHKGTIRTPEELVDDHHPLRYNPFEHDGLLRFYESFINSMKKSSEHLLHIYCGVNNR